MKPTAIQVTRPFLPPRVEYQKYLEGIWARGWITNQGPLIGELEQRLRDLLGVDHVMFVANGTLALQIAIRALGLQGEIITTPFSHIATTSSIIWEGCTPVMVDIDSDTLNLDPARIEDALTKSTSAILATHVYGNPCEIEAIKQIADRYDLKVIYDAAHAFGSLYDGEPVFGYGDVSAASFHATKVFHTVEGGAVCTRSPEIAREAALLRNFGHVGPNDFARVGINAKNSELHAAMGLSNLPYIDQNLYLRRSIVEQYDRNLSGLPLRRPAIADRSTWNYAYYPVVFESETVMIRVMRDLNSHHIYPRRYFFPSLPSLPFIERRGSTPVSDDISHRVLCLPLFTSLSKDNVDHICRVVRETVEA